MIKKMLNGAKNQRQNIRQAEFYRNLIRHEAKIGGKLFGPVPKGHRREFFCLDVNTWIWHEEWTQGGQKHIKTTRYDIRPDAILKSHDGQHYQRLELAEAKNFQQAVHAYQGRVRKELYSFA